MTSQRWHSYLKSVEDCRTTQLTGRIIKVSGIVAEANGPGLGIGSLCAIKKSEGGHIPAEVIGFKDDRLMIMPFGEIRGIKPGSQIIDISKRPSIALGNSFLGRVVDGLGRPIDGKGPLRASAEYPLYGQPLNPLNREVIRDVIDVGIGSINALITLGKGQRVGIMSGSGVGKSVLMGMIAKNTSADVSVIGLIGERGREVREFVENSLGEEGLKRSVVVAATSDSPTLVRLRGAYLAGQHQVVGGEETDVVEGEIVDLPNGEWDGRFRE